MQCTQTVRAAWCAGVVLALVLIMPVAPAAAKTGKEERASLLIPSAGWHGRPIQQPRSAPAVRVRAERPPRGWEAGPASLGTGTHRAAGSQRVRELQWRLKALGYRPGPIDGIFGVRTRAAVAWFQVKHGFPVNGRATFAVVRHLRNRTTPDQRAPEALARPVRDQRARPVRDQRAAPAPVVASVEAGGTPLWAVLGMLLLAFASGFAVVAWRQRRPATRAIGYARTDDGHRRLDAHASTMEARCADRGIALAGMITDDAADERTGRDRPGLAHAFQQVQEGAVDCLVVGRVEHLTGSPDELVALLESMPETPIVVLNAEPVPARSGRWARRTRTLDSGARDG
jgi:hypothetical protein